MIVRWLLVALCTDQEVNSNPAIQYDPVVPSIAIHPYKFTTRILDRIQGASAPSEADRALAGCIRQASHREDPTS